MTTFDLQGLGKRVAQYRRLANISAGTLAEAAGNGITRAVIANIETGRKKDPTITQVLAIAWALGISPLALVYDLSAPDSPVISQGGHWEDLTVGAAVDWWDGWPTLGVKMTPGVFSPYRVASPASKALAAVRRYFRTKWTLDRSETALLLSTNPPRGLPKIEKTPAEVELLTSRVRIARDEHVAAERELDEARTELEAPDLADNAGGPLEALAGDEDELYSSFAELGREQKLLSRQANSYVRALVSVARSADSAADLGPREETWLESGFSEYSPSSIVSEVAVAEYERLVGDASKGLYVERLGRALEADEQRMPDSGGNG